MEELKKPQFWLKSTSIDVACQVVYVVGKKIFPQQIYQICSIFILFVNLNGVKGVIWSTMEREIEEFEIIIKINIKENLEHGFFNPK